MARSKSEEDESLIPESSLSPPALKPQTSPAGTAEADILDEEGLDEEGLYVRGEIVEPTAEEVNARTSLLGNYHHNRVCGLRNCNHGTFSPRASSIHSDRSSVSSSINGFDDQYPDTFGEGPSPSNRPEGVLGHILTDGPGGSKSMNTTKWLARKHGIKNSRFMYLAYYFPFLKWMQQYQWRWFQGDLVAALTMASFYIPMALSYASNLGHIPPINGLYSFVFNPIIYALLGSCPQLVVGPEAAGSLLVGTVVRTCIDKGQSGDDDDVLNAQIAGVVTAISGSIIFVAGLTRLGFLDSVLSRPFLRGFISAIGFVILVDQAIPELGLSEISRQAGDISHGSSAQKLTFLFRNMKHTHGLTAVVSITSFAIIMIFR